MMPHSLACLHLSQKILKWTYRYIQHSTANGNAAAAVARRFGLTFATMRWKVMSSSSILSFPFPNFLSAHAQGPKPHSGIRWENRKGGKKVGVRVTRWIGGRERRRTPLGSLRLVYSRTSRPDMAWSHDERGWNPNPGSERKLRD